MRTIALFALLVLAANAFNLTEYHQGVDAQLGFNETQVEAGLTCLSALSVNGAQISDILTSKNFDDIVENLGSQIEQLKIDFNTTCAPYFLSYAEYYAKVSGTWNVTVWNQDIKQNFEQFYPQIIQQVAQWYSLIQAGEDFQAGEIQSYIGQVLIGDRSPAPIEVTPANVTVPFNSSEFYSEYFGTIFQALGIQASVNVSALIQCNYNIKNTTGNYVYIKQNFSSFDFEQKLNAVQYIMNLAFETVRNCEGAAELAGLIMVPQFEAFKEDPVNFTLEVANRIALDLPEYIASIQREFVDIQEGDYVAAAQEKVDRINNDFQGLVNYTISN